MADSSRRILNQKYRLLGPLGKGGMGMVFRAEQLDVEGRAQRQVAVKTLRRELSTDPLFKQRFLREVRVTMQLRSPHTVAVYDSGQDETGQLYYVMELVEGPSLYALLLQQGRLAVGRTVTLASQVCEALAEAHGLHEPVIHRDLKPANIFLEQRQGMDWAKLGDFGIAKVAGDETMGQTRVGSSPGTPLYMAPEQWLGRPVDARTDLYALGLIVYEMLSGHPPFSADGGIEALMGQHLHEPPPPLPETIPVSLENVVARLLAKDPQQRPPDAERVRQNLEAALSAKDDEPPVRLNQETSTGIQARPPRWRGPLALALTAGLVLLMGLAVLLLPSRRAVRSVAIGPSVVQLSAPLALRLAVIKRRGEIASLLKDNDVLTATDYYGVFFEPAQDSFVYIFQQDAGGSIDILFPDPAATPQGNPVSAGTSVWVPQDSQHWFYLDSTTGRETIFVAASHEQNPQLEAILRNVQTPRGQQTLASWLSSPERGRGGVQRLETEAAIQPVLNGQSLDLDTLFIQGGGADFVYRVAFEHQ